ncbi:MAG TPA: hypothetical protein VK964_06925 [Nocardioidaceae bacterium]|nr:hypothetical protein [Nocardioidaceae bacterium]
MGLPVRLRTVGYCDPITPHRQRSLWAFPLLGTAVDYGVRTLNRLFIEGVKAKMEVGPTVPGQRKPTATKTPKPAASR